MLRVFYALLLCVGLVISGYLLFRYFSLSADEPQRGEDICSEILGHGCDQSLLHPVSRQLGLPLAGWGVVYYGTLLALMLLGQWLADAFRREADVAALVLAILGAIGSIVLAGVMACGISPFCPLCAAIHAINATLPVVLWKTTGRTLLNLAQALCDAVKYSLGRDVANAETARWRLLGLLTVALVAVVLYQWVVIQVGLQVESSRSLNVQQLIDEFESSPRQSIPLNREDASLGPENAPVGLVVFSDFHCPACQRLAKQIPRLMDRFPESLRITFKHYPLGVECNNALKKDLHPQACEAAWVSEAAKSQGKFWEFHDAVFRTSSNTSPNVIAAQVGLDLGDVEAAQREIYRQKVEADVALAIELGVDGTPAVFLDGKRVYDLRLQALQRLVEHQLSNSKH